MVPKLEDPEANPIAYRNLVLTTTFFAGIFQAAFGLFRWFVNNCSFAG
jgi:low affinity sulfate transporter 2